MKKTPMPLSLAIFLLIVGLFIGTVFTFGFQYWNAEVTREDCIKVETQFVSHDEIRRRKGIKEIYIDCTNGERYSIDGVCINKEIRKAVSKIPENEEITLLIHPNSDTVVEFTCESGTLLTFDETIDKLEGEATGFLFFGLFMYFCALVGFYHIVLYSVHKFKN